jgi:hypothetical protein
MYNDAESDRLYRAYEDACIAYEPFYKALTAGAAHTNHSLTARQSREDARRRWIESRGETYVACDYGDGKVSAATRRLLTRF